MLKLIASNLVTSVATAAILSFFVGVGIDYERIARDFGSSLVRPRIETGSFAQSRSQTGERDRWKAEIAEARAGARKAAADYNACLQAARDSFWKMWDPDGHCAEERIISLAAGARYEAWK